MLKKGTCVDTSIVQSSTKPLGQIDTNASSTEKRGKKYFGYKGYTGTDIDSKIIHKRSFTSTRRHGSTQMV